MDRLSCCYGRFMPKLLVLHVYGDGGYVSNAVYSGWFDNIGFRATAITSSTSAWRAKAVECLLISYGDGEDLREAISCNAMG